MSKATQKILDALHGALAKDLATRLVEGEDVVVKDSEGNPRVLKVKASAATLGQIRQFLKDNHIEVDATTQGKDRFKSILENLPFAGTEDDSSEFSGRGH